jgi:hypothetical protein
MAIAERSVFMMGVLSEGVILPPWK